MRARECDRELGTVTYTCHSPGVYFHYFASMIQLQQCCNRDSITIPDSHKYLSPFRLTAFAYGSTLETTLGGMVCALDEDQVGEFVPALHNISAQYHCSQYPYPFTVNTVNQKRV